MSSRHPDGDWADRGKPRGAPKHDVFIVTRRTDAKPRDVDLYRLINDNGEYKTAPEPVPSDGEEYRSVLNLAGNGNDEPDCGPAIATLPLHPDPSATSACTCYLINTENLKYPSVWISEEFSDPPGGFNANGEVGADSFELVIASPSGDVYHLQAANGRSDMTKIDLSEEVDIWQELRNGCVAGRVRYRDRIVPIVSVDALSPVRGGGKENLHVVL